MKTARCTKARRISDFYNRMTALGFTYAETETLRRAQLTLHRWSERECNGEVEREGADCDGRPFSGISRTGRKLYVPDLEKGAWKRVLAAVDIRNARESAAYLHKTREALPNLVAFHQTDCRGCALYLVEGSPIDDVSNYYNRGFGVCID